MVVPAVNGRDTLLHALDALAGQEGPVRLEILVPERTGEEVRAAVRERFPGARLLPVDSSTSIPTMRRLAFESARAPVVAVIEDHVIVPPDWATRMIEAVRQGHPVVGGWVFNAATERLVDRAAFLCEYQHMLSPPKTGPTSGVTGNNVAYDRGILERFWSVVEEDRWEGRLHGAIVEGGVALFCDAEISAAHKMHYANALEYAGQRFLYSRAYAAMRVRGASKIGAWSYGLAALALPPLLLVRLLRHAWPDPAVRRDLIRSLPYQLLFVTSWGLGEVVGALAGPGRALERVR